MTKTKRYAIGAKPCPFCGGRRLKVVARRAGRRPVDRRRVKCEDCLASGPPAGVPEVGGGLGAGYSLSALDAWDRRAED